MVPPGEGLEAELLLVEVEENVFRAVKLDCGVVLSDVKNACNSSLLVFFGVVVISATFSAGILIPVKPDGERFETVV